MHPIEHLRYVARARGADPAALVRETAHAISSMRFDPSGLVVACRRILERHPECGPLWWFCARVLTAAEPFETAWQLAEEIESDATGGVLAAALPDDATVVVIGWPGSTARALQRRGDVRVLVVDSCHHGSGLVQRLERHDVACDLVPAEMSTRAVASADLVLLEADALSAVRVVSPVGSAVLATLAGAVECPLWLVAGLGRVLPDPFVVAMDERMSIGAEPWLLEHDVWSPSSVTHVVRPAGAAALDQDALAPECPSAPELLRSSPI